MQLKNGFHLITNTNLLASVPNHNNNQPFSGVNLVVNEVQGGNDEPVTVYSLYENGLGEEGGEDLTPEGSQNLNFTPNEYGFLELLTDDEDDEDGFHNNSSSSSSSDEDDDDPPQQSLCHEDVKPDPSTIKVEPVETITVSCITCGCFGLLNEFHDDKHCTYDCALITRITEAKKKMEEQMKLEQEKEEVKEEQGKGAPVELFRQPAFPLTTNPFKVNDLLEAIDPEHQCFFCPVRVVETLGYRVLLKFIGFPDKYNFWVNADSEDIFPVEWTTTYTHHQLHFHAPPNFTWSSYITSNPTHRIAPQKNFPHIEPLLNQNSPVKVGMKLEAVDVRNKNLVCVATVSCVMGNRFLIHFDSWDSLYDYWTTLESAWVHPVGYCKSRGIEITPPHCYETASEFEWEEYLKKTSSLPVPKELFNQQPPVGFQVGHELEVVDKRSPRLLRTATVSAVNNHVLTLTILNDPQYNFEKHDRSPDLHPVSWHSATFHPIDSEILPTETSCPNHTICRSTNSIRGPEFSTHSKSRDCPYSLANLNETTTLTDRVVIFEDKYYDLGGIAEGGEDENQQNPPEPPAKKLCLDKPKPLLSPRNSLLPTPINFASQTKSPPHIPKKSEILNWSHDKISNLVQGLCSNLPTAQKVADQFRNNLIDGESFLMLTQSDMTDALGIKLGPAVKIYNLIRLIDLNK